MCCSSYSILQKHSTRHSSESVWIEWENMHAGWIWERVRRSVAILWARKQDWEESGKGARAAAIWRRWFLIYTTLSLINIKSDLFIIPPRCLVHPHIMSSFGLRLRFRKISWLDWLFPLFRSRRTSVSSAHSGAYRSSSRPGRNSMLFIVTLDTTESFNTSDFFSIFRQCDSTPQLRRMAYASGVSSLPWAHYAHTLTLSVDFI